MQIIILFSPYPNYCRTHLCTPNLLTGEGFSTVSEGEEEDREKQENKGKKEDVQGGSEKSLTSTTRLKLNFAIHEVIGYSSNI